MEEGEESLKVAVLEWMSDSGHLLNLQQQCEEYGREEKVGPAYEICIEF